MKLKSILETTYKEYKADSTVSQKKKLNIAIQEVNRALFEIERYLKQNKRLQEEEGIDKFWKSTAYKFVKMNERVKSIQKQIRRFGLKEMMLEIEQDQKQKKIDFIVACNTELKPKDQWKEEDLKNLAPNKLDRVVTNRVNMLPSTAT